MPSEISELPQFFDTIEKLYQIYQMPDDLRAKLLIPKLSSRAKSIIVRMTAEDLGRYDEVKRFLLAEYKLTPREYKNRLDSAVKGNDETGRQAPFRHSPFRLAPFRQPPFRQEKLRKFGRRLTVIN